MIYIQTKLGKTAEQALKLSPKISPVFYFQKTNSTTNEAATDCTAAAKVPLMSKQKLGPKRPASPHPLTPL